MVLETRQANYIGWPFPALISMVQRYKKYLNYANIFATFFKFILKNHMAGIRYTLLLFPGNCKEFAKSFVILQREFTK